MSIFCAHNVRWTLDMYGSLLTEILSDEEESLFSANAQDMQSVSNCVAP